MFSKNIILKPDPDFGREMNKLSLFNRQNVSRGQYFHDLVQQYFGVDTLLLLFCPF